MATIVITTSKPTGTVVGRTNMAMPDADLDAIVASYQQGANTAINGTATYVQVLTYMFGVLVVDAMKRQTQSFQTSPPVVPPPPAITVS